MVVGEGDEELSRLAISVLTSPGPPNTTPSPLKVPLPSWICSLGVATSVGGEGAGRVGSAGGIRTGESSGATAGRAGVDLGESDAVDIGLVGSGGAGGTVCAVYPTGTVCTSCAVYAPGAVCSAGDVCPGCTV
jgi:hypothetical protein